MNDLSTKSKLHSRMKAFAKWVAPDPGSRDGIHQQIKDVKTRISAKAAEDEITITSTPLAGSFAKKTGLRRHMRGEAEVEGQDIDVPFVVKPAEEGGYFLGPMVDRFFSYANDCYPKTKKEKTKSSVKLIFMNNLSFDLVPLYEGGNSETQILVRSTGEQIETSVQKHNEFIRSRTSTSDKLKGVVLFNECVRLMKWWRYVRCTEGNYLTELPSIIVDLLCAKAFDRLSVKQTYAQTMSKWFAFLAHLVRKRENVIFNDFSQASVVGSESIWHILDPANPENNLVEKMQWYEVEELSGWFESSRDTWNRVVVADLREDDARSLEQLVALFGNSFKNHCEE